MKKISLALWVIAFGIIINSCNDPSPIGAELLEDDQVEVLFSDTLTLRTSTVKEDNIVVFDPDPSVTFDNFLIGDMEDPIFGRATASLYAQLTLDFDAPDYTDATVDSIVLTLQYDSLSTYGILDQEAFDLGVYRIMDVVDIENEHFSNESFMVDESTPLAEINNLIPQLSSSDSIKGLIDYRFDDEGDTIDIPASLRIHLPLSLAEELINYDSIIYNSDNNFVEQFNGIHVRAMSSTPGMLSVNISEISVSGMTVYYRKDGSNEQYTYEFSSRFVQMSNFSHDFSGSTVENFFDDPVLGDSILFVQSMSGPNIKIEIPNADAFQGSIINKAELIFTIAELNEDDPANYPPIFSIIAADLDEDEEFSFVQDILIGGSNFGGVFIETADGFMEYRMNLSAHFQEIIDGDRANTIFLRAFPKQEQADRTVVFGPGHSTHPMKLKLTYTKL